MENFDDLCTASLLKSGCTPISALDIVSDICYWTEHQLWTAKRQQDYYKTIYHFCLLVASYLLLHPILMNKSKSNQGRKRCLCFMGQLINKLTFQECRVTVWISQYEEINGQLAFITDDDFHFFILDPSSSKWFVSTVNLSLKSRL